MKKKKTNKSSVQNNFDTVAFVIICGLAFVLYFNTLQHGYTLDDFSVIKENIITTQGVDGISTILKTSYRYGYLSIDDGLYRPLSLITYAIEWEFFPDKPAIAHVVNVLLYILTGVVLYKVLRKLFHKQNEFIPLITTLLFIAHPIHTEIVASIKSRDEILCFLFSFLSANSVIDYTDKKKKVSLILSGLFFFLALLSKESGITMAAVIPLMIYFFRNEKIKNIAFATIPILVTTIIYLIIRSKVLGSAQGLESISYVDNSILATKDKTMQLATAFSVLFEYVKLLFLPLHLVCDRSYNEIPNMGFTNIKALLGLGIHLALAAFAIIGLKKKTPMGFAIAFYLITIALFSNVLIKIGSVMAERFVYFASFGFCIAIVLLLVRFLKINTEQKINSISTLISLSKPASTIITALLIFYSLKTISRNKDWENNFTLYSNDVNLSPNSCRIHYYLGRELIKEYGPNEKNPQKQKEYFEWGIKEMEISIAIAPNYNDAYSQMGLGYKRMGNSEKAIECYERGLKIQPNDPITLNNLAAEYFAQKKYKESIDIFERILKLDPRYVDAMVNLASCYGTIQNFDKAIYWFERAVQISPTNARAYYYLGLTYGYINNKQKSDENLQKAYQLDPSLKPKQ